jgi:hypothetical protein
LGELDEMSNQTKEFEGKGLIVSSISQKNYVQWVLNV